MKPRKNKEAMADVIAELKSDGLFYGDKVQVKKVDDSGDEAEAVPEKKRDKKEKSKKDKKAKKEESDVESDEELEKAKKKDKKRAKH